MKVPPQPIGFQENPHLVTEKPKVKGRTFIEFRCWSLLLTFDTDPAKMKISATNI